MTTFLVKKESEDAFIPSIANNGSIGYDLRSRVDMIVSSKCWKLIDIGISVAIPEGHYGRIAPKSGLALKYMIGVEAGVIDPNYRGNICVILSNNSNSDFEIKRGDKIAQLILEKASVFQVEEVKDLDTTERGSGGFGSTGR